LRVRRRGHIRQKNWEGGVGKAYCCRKKKIEYNKAERWEYVGSKRGPGEKRVTTPGNESNIVF